MDYYKNPEKEYFEFVFSNNKAIDNRFLKLKFGGEFVQKFTRDFNIPEIANKYRMDYIYLAKELLYLQQVKQSNEYKREFVNDNVLGLKGRKRNVYDEITWVIDRYSKDQKEYDDYIDLLNTCITGYREMISGLVQEKLVIEEEVVE